MVQPAESCKGVSSCRLLGDEDTLTVMSSTSQVCRGKELPAGEDTEGSCGGHSGMPGFGRQGIEPKKRVRVCGCRRKKS